MVVAGWISDMPICTLHARTHQLVRWDKQETTGVCNCMHAILDLQQDACNSDIRTATNQTACNSDMHTRRAVHARTHARTRAQVLRRHFRRLLPLAICRWDSGAPRRAPAGLERRRRRLCRLCHGAALCACAFAHPRHVRPCRLARVSDPD